MHFGALLKSFIYLISCSLLYPVLFLLSILTIWLLFVAGSFIAEWVARTRLKKPAAGELQAMISANNFSTVFSHTVLEYSNSLAPLIEAGEGNNAATIENLLQAASLKMWKSIDRIGMLVKIGPGLGLIGTLIPMGTGLAALGQGDISKLSSDLVIAFTTTVVGLALGLVAYFFLTIRRRWVEEDIRAMEYITEILTSAKAKEADK